MVKRGMSKRGKKSSHEATHEDQQKETVSTDKDTFKGKLSHTSPLPDRDSREKKITGYFPALKCDGEPLDVDRETVLDTKADDKSLALHRVFARAKLSSPDKGTSGTSPHRILLSETTERPHTANDTAKLLENPSSDPDAGEAVVLKEPKVEAAAPVDATVTKEPKVSKATKAKRKLNISQSVNKDAAQNNHKLTEYFAVRRSVRKPKTALLEEKQRCLEEAVLSGKEDGLEVHNFPGKGRGIIASRLFQRGEFVVEYFGDLIDLTEAREREKIYAADQNTGCYMYYFQHKNQSYCVDATAESPRLGRLVNHSRSGNLLPKIIEINDRPRLLLVARNEILPGEELLYDYGDRSRQSLKHHPWLAN